MFQLAYISTASREFSVDELTDLSNDAGIRNRKINVTGLLLHHNGAFLQFLEGSEDTIRALYEHIARDPRHSDCKIVYTQEASTRLFSNWFTRYLSFEYIKEITDEQLSEDIEELLTRMMTDEDEMTRVINKFASVVSSHQSG